MRTIQIETEQAVSMINSLTFLAQYAAEEDELPSTLFTDIFELIRELLSVVSVEDEKGNNV